MYKLISLLFCIHIFTWASAQETLTMEDCRQRVLSYNPTLKKQAKEVESSESNILANKKDYLPTFDMSGNYTHLQYPQQLVVSDTKIEAAQSMYIVNAPLIQNIYSGGAVRKRNELAQLQNNLAISVKNNVEDNILLQTELSFWSSVYNEEMINLSSKYKEAIDGLVKVIKDKVDFEIISKNDLLLLEVRQNEAELFKLMTKNKFEVSLMELNRIIGNPIESEIKVSGDLAGTEEEIDATSLSSVYNIRPELISQKSRIEIQKTNADLIKANYLPNVYAGIIPSWGVPNTNIGGTDPVYNTSFVAGVNIPIVRWGKKKHDVKKEISLAEAKTFEMQELKDKVTLEVHSTSYQLDETIIRKELTEASLEKSVTNLDIMTDRYLEGLTSILEVLDAQLYWQRAYKDMLDARLLYKMALAYHKKAIGLI